MYYLPSEELDDPFTSGVQHKLKKTNQIQDADKNDNFFRIWFDEVANMATASPWESFGQLNLPELRTGNLFLRPQCGRTYTRKVVR
ncbi:hypothetical protein Patl1_29549 [Pistacia atlantica]|uniref:Uncharacterized protein n=1 Tax=Pistacia atlantica TaxID=434234 RepID=A0ACC1ADC6_9ROSI|nr:hypothetical protein Patl1_29549 [Pistacia atlantica]